MLITIEKNMAIDTKQLIETIANSSKKNYLYKNCVLLFKEFLLFQK
jgi:hypothetical protein